MTEQTVSLINVTKSFDGASVLSGFCAEIDQNTAIMGTSGKGKTTVARIIMGILKADGGEVRYAQPPVFSCVFQEDRLFEAFSAVENVAAVCEKKFGKRSAREHASELLCELLIDEGDLEKPVCTFSGGMKRRVALARALAKDSNILILDEAFKGLDSNTREACADCVRRYAADRLVIMITHDKEDAELCGISNFICIDDK